jgi:hypothetical protein
MVNISSSTASTNSGWRVALATRSLSLSFCYQPRDRCNVYEAQNLPAQNRDD